MFNPEEADDLMSLEVDGHVEYLPDISYKLFEEFLGGTSEVDYKNYLIGNKMKEITDYNSETTKDLKFVVESKYRERKIVFKVVHDSDWESDGNL